MPRPALASWGRHADVGLLILRLGMGVMLIFRGVSRLAGGRSAWAEAGGVPASLLALPPDAAAATALGALLAGSLVVGGVLMILGWGFRPAVLVLAVLASGAVVLAWRGPLEPLALSPTLEAAAVFLGLALVGPGRWSVDGR